MLQNLHEDYRAVQEKKCNGNVHKAGRKLKRFAKMVNLYYYYSALAGALRVLLVQASVLKCSFSVFLLLETITLHTFFLPFKLLPLFDQHNPQQRVLKVLASFLHSVLKKQHKSIMKINFFSCT